MKSDESMISYKKSDCDKVKKKKLFYFFVCVKSYKKK